MPDLLTCIRKAQAELAGELRRNPTALEVAFEMGLPSYIVLSALSSEGDSA